MRRFEVRFLSAAICLLIATPALGFSVTVTPQLTAYDDAPASQGGVPARLTVQGAGWFGDPALTVAGTACALTGTAGCTRYAPQGDVVLTPVSGINFVFAGWSGCTSVAGDACTVSLTSNRTVVARFRPAAYTYRVATAPRPTATWTPPYGGAVSIGGVSYRSTATVAYTSVLLPAGVPTLVTAVPDPGSIVSSWSGCTPATPAATTCTVTPYMATALTVAFTAPPAAVVRVVVAGAGSVTGPSMSCREAGGDCETVAPVTLTAVPDTGMKFAGWTGCASTPTTTSCTVDAAAFVTATFKKEGCNACHGLPPEKHLTWGTSRNCGDCHPGYTAESVNAATHMNSRKDTTPPDQVKPVCATGLKLDITGVVLNPGDNRPTVTFTALDRNNQPVDILGEMANWSYLPRFTISRIVNGKAVNYNVRKAVPPGTGALLTAKPMDQAQSESPTTGTLPARLTCTTGGSCTYKFPVPIVANPADNYDVFPSILTTAPHSVTVFATRNVAGKPHECYQPAFDEWTVGAQPAPMVTDAKCNACHGNLQLHGGRRGIAVCKACHNSNQSGDPETGNSVELSLMVHKIHMGEQLAFGYTIVGYQGAVADYGHVKMGPSHSSSFSGVDPDGPGGPLVAATVADDGIVRKCSICHVNDPISIPPPNKALAEVRCSSCHDDTVFVENDVNGDGLTDQMGHGSYLAPTCGTCHNGSLPNRHSDVYETANNLNFSNLYPPVPPTGHAYQLHITGVSVDAAGTPAIEFTATLDGQPFTDLLTHFPGGYTADPYLGNLAFNVYGPTTEVMSSSTKGCAADGALSTSAGGCTIAAVDEFAGQYRATFAGYVDAGGAAQPAWTPLAGKTTGTSWVVAVESYYARTATNNGVEYARKPFATDPSPFTLTRTDAGWVNAAIEAERRRVVSNAKCNHCHVDLGFHSNRNRQGADYCAACHNPTLDNGGRIRFKPRQTDTGAVGGTYLPESVSMNVFIHRIHMGKESTAVSDPASVSPLFNNTTYAGAGDTLGHLIYGGNSYPVEFSEFVLPSPSRRCATCHLDPVAGQSFTWALPDPDALDLEPVERTPRVCDVGNFNPAFPANTWPDEDAFCGKAYASGTRTSGYRQTATGKVACGSGLAGAPAPCACTASEPCYGPPAALPAAKVYTAPGKAVCTSCHDDANTNTHADAFTTYTGANQVEYCGTCHGPGKIFDAQVVHKYY